MERYLYSNSIKGFLKDPANEILGQLSQNSTFADEETQKYAWREQVKILKACLTNKKGRIFFEYEIPRMGGRVDVIIIISNVIFVVEFKVGESKFLSSSVDQVWDYALDLKNFHETSHHPTVAPMLVATEATRKLSPLVLGLDADGLLSPPLRTNASSLDKAIDSVLEFVTGDSIDCNTWDSGQYSPTPTIIEAAKRLYQKHSVYAITRKDASAAKLRNTTDAVFEIIENSRKTSKKSICFITGVPGAGKTLVGLEIATKYLDSAGTDRSVFLSGNGPLVAILTEALARDQVMREKAKGRKLRIGKARGEVKTFVQIVHKYRDLYLKEKLKPPIDQVAIFDEAQRAWNLKQTASFMKRKKDEPNFDKSESEFLVSCLDRHKDWAVIVCLVGGGQEIYKGEAGIGEWLRAMERSYEQWNVYISDRLSDSEYAAEEILEQMKQRERLIIDNRLHLSVSMRSFRAENVSAFVKAILNLEMEEATHLYRTLKDRYPLVITRDVNRAKTWLRKRARGSERFGMIASSNAYRLKPHAINVKAKVNPVNWFLEGKEDVRSSYYLEDVATEFQVQGLELDWTCVMWDADFRYSSNGWGTFEFVGTKWNNVKAEERRQYLKNAYRVLLTRARQGMVIAVPWGDSSDKTRNPEFYDKTYDFLKTIGIEEL